MEYASEGIREVRQDVRRLREENPLTMLGVEVAASMFSGGGEFLDAELATDPEAAWWERGLAGISLAVNSPTAGFLPNITPFLRRADDAVEAVGDLTRRVDDVPVGSTTPPSRGSGGGGGGGGGGGSEGSTPPSSGGSGGSTPPRSGGSGGSMPPSSGGGGGGGTTPPGSGGSGVGGSSPTPPRGLTDQQVLQQSLAVRNANVTPSNIRGATPDPVTGRTAHAYGNHGFTNDMISDVINNADHMFVGHNGTRPVNIFVRGGDVVVTQGDDVTRIITAYGASGYQTLPGGRRVPGQPVDINRWRNDRNYFEVD